MVDGETSPVFLEYLPKPRMTKPMFSSNLDSTSKIYPTAKIVDSCKLEMGEHCIIGDMAFIAVQHLKMEDGAQIAPHAIVSGGGEVYMEAYSAVGFGSQLITGTDSPEGELMCEAAEPSQRKVIRGSITLQHGAYIGSGAIVCVSKRQQHIVIGENAVVGALTYIDESVDPYIVVHPDPTLIYKDRRTGEKVQGLRSSPPQRCLFMKPIFGDSIQVGEHGGPIFGDLIQVGEHGGPIFGDLIQVGEHGGPIFGDLIFDSNQPPSLQPTKKSVSCSDRIEYLKNRVIAFWYEKDEHVREMRLLTQDYQEFGDACRELESL
ncbi:hypothetical protein MUP59_10145, partial [Candidatus Bathyarchaeota archaeon]|nr:hypothetical protein [Candidatus Bathyarchaeota archaeon]